jgi:hypothetical protein
MVDIALKSFMEQHFDFAGLKKAGMFKGVRKDDYQKQADIICHKFGFSSIFEWIAQPKVACHISTVSSIFKCPICTCEQEVGESHEMQYTMNCQGCKRKLLVRGTWTGFVVTDYKDDNEKADTYY